MKIKMLKTTKRDGRWYHGGSTQNLHERTAKALIQGGYAVELENAPGEPDPNLVDLSTPANTPIGSKAKLVRDTEVTEEHDHPEDFIGDTRRQRPDIDTEQAEAHNEEGEVDESDLEEVEEEVEEDDPEEPTRKRKVKKKVRRKKSRR